MELLRVLIADVEGISRFVCFYFVFSVALISLYDWLNEIV